jgi:hypothetical protein
MARVFMVIAFLVSFSPVASFGRGLDQKRLIQELKVHYAKVASYKGELDIIKNSVHEKAQLEYTPGRTVLRYTLGPQQGQEIIVKSGVIFKEILGMKMPIPILSKVFQEANGDMGQGYVIARMNEEMERIKAGVPITSEVEDLGEYFVIRSRYAGEESYRYRRAEVMINKKLFLPVRAAYDTKGEQRYNEVYRFSFSDIRFLR